MSPQTIRRAKFAEILNKPSLNKQQAKKFIAKYSIDYFIENVVLPESFVLKSNKNKTQIRLLDRSNNNEPRIAYAVNIKVTTKKISCRSCTQVLVWASPDNEDMLIGFPRKIFNHLLDTYAIMITDQEQTPDGKRFWERRIAQAFKDGMFVYFWDESNSISPLEQIKNNDDFLENYEPKAWGDDMLHKSKLLIIGASQIF